MSPEVKFIVFQFLIIVPFMIGAVLRKRFKSPEESGRKIIRVSLIVFLPQVVLWTTWKLPMTLDLLLLPVAGFFIVITGFFIGFPASSFLKLKDLRKKTFLISSSLVNHGFTMGGFICYLFIGEKGLALAMIMLTYFMPYTFLFIFPYAGFNGAKEKLIPYFFKNLFSLQNMPLFAVIAAFTLQLLNIPRPKIYYPVDILMACGIMLNYFTLGLNFRLSDLAVPLKDHMMIALIKFMIMPIIVMTILSSLNVERDIYNTIAIQSFMPAAVYSVVTAVLYRLDVKEASGLFVVNTLLFTVILLPLLFFFKEFFFRF